MGVDRAAKVGAGNCAVEVLARGLDGSEPAVGAVMSLAPPGEAFSAAAAMERNALVYASAEVSVVIHARHRAGGSWHGALDALRRRLSVVLVGPCEARPTLLALGAYAVDSPRQAMQMVLSPPVSRNLWSPLEGIDGDVRPAVASSVHSEA